MGWLAQWEWLLIELLVLGLLVAELLSLRRDKRRAAERERARVEPPPQ